VTTPYYTGLIAEANVRDERERIARRLRDETTFCDHGRNMCQHCTACDDEEANR